MSKEMVKKIVKALDDKKAINPKIIDISKVSVVADYFLIASGSNQNQVQAMADNVCEEMEKAGFSCRQIEGYRSANWILLDFGDIIIHIFIYFLWCSYIKFNINIICIYFLCTWKILCVVLKF